MMFVLQRLKEPIRNKDYPLYMSFVDYLKSVSHPTQNPSVDYSSPLWRDTENSATIRLYLDGRPVGAQLHNGEGSYIKCST